MDGPYDLNFEISTRDANATPWPERRPTIKVALEGDVLFNSFSVEHHEPRYEDVKAFVADYPRRSGYFILPPDAYREVQVMIGVASSLEELEDREIEAARLARSPSEKHGWRVFGGMMGPVQ